MSTKIPDLNALYSRLVEMDVNSLPNDVAIETVGTLIDLSEDLERSEGIDRALQMCDEIEARSNDEADAALLQYFRANAWSAFDHDAKRGQSGTWNWEQPFVAKQIYYLRRCVAHPGFKCLHDIRKCQVFTNLANLLNTVGRFVEALEVWEYALTLRPRFGMALGNKGYGLERYARSLYDGGHQILFAKFAHANLSAATQADAEYDGNYPDAIAQFDRLRSEIEVLIPQLNNIELHPHGMGKSKAEQAYRGWCLHNRLFLNPLNDLGEHSIANQDVLLMPSFFTKAGEPPTLIGFFNQIKQEYASARWFLYEGLFSNTVHFSDRNVLLYNTLDYPCQSLSVEKTKIAFRMAYSLFDKVAYFLNEYLHLGIKARDVYFKTLWYQNRSTKPFPLRTEFVQRDNWPFRGLFWLAKDLFDEKSLEVIEPDARDLHLIRNHLEHTYLKVQDEFLKGFGPDSDDFWFDRLAYVIARDELGTKTLKLFKLVRAALIYLMLGMHREESRMIGGRDEAKTMPMTLSLCEDDWKR